MLVRSIFVFVVALLTATALAVIPGAVSEAEAQTMNLENAEITLLDPDKHLYRYTTLPAPKITSPEGYFENYYITDNSNSITFTSTAHEFEFHKNTCSFTVRDGDGNTELGDMAQKFYINSGSRWQDITPESCTAELTDSNKTHAKITASSDSRGIEFDVIFDIYYAGYVEWTYEITNNQRNIANPQLGIVEICTDCTSADNPFLNQDGTVSDPLAFRQAGLDDKARKGEGAPGKREYDRDTIGDKLLSVGAGVYDPKNDQHGTLSAIRLDDNNMEVEFFGTQALPFGQTMIIDPSYVSPMLTYNSLYYRIDMLANPPAAQYAWFPALQSLNNTNDYVLGYAQFHISGIPDDAIVRSITLVTSPSSWRLRDGLTWTLYPSPFQITSLGRLTAQQTTQLNQALGGDIYYTAEFQEGDLAYYEPEYMQLNNNAVRDLRQKLEQGSDKFELLAGVSHGYRSQYNSHNVALIIDYEIIGRQLVIDAAPTPQYLGVKSSDNYNHALGSSWTVQDRSDGTFKVGNQDTRTLAGGIQFDVSEIGDDWMIDDLAVGMEVLQKSDTMGNFEFARGSKTMPDYADWDGSPISTSQQTTLDAFAYKLTRSPDYTPAGSANTVTGTGYQMFELDDRAISDLKFSAEQTADTETFAADIFRPNIRPADSDTSWYMKINADPAADSTGTKPRLYIDYSILLAPTGEVSNPRLVNLAPVSNTEINYTFDWDYTGSDPAHFAMTYTLDSGTSMYASTADGDTLRHTIRAGYDIERFQVRAVFSDGSNTDAAAVIIDPPEAVEIVTTTKDSENPAEIKYGWTHNYADHDIDDLAFELQYRLPDGDIQSATPAGASSHTIYVIPETAYQVRAAFKVGDTTLATTDWSTITSGSWPTIDSLTIDAVKAQSMDISFEFGEYDWLDRFVVLTRDSNQLSNTTVSPTDRTATIIPDSPFPAGNITVHITPYASDGSAGPTVEEQVEPIKMPPPPPPPPVNEGDTVDYTILIDNPDNQDIQWSIISGKRGNAVLESDGRFTWTSTEADGPGTYEFGIEADAVTNTQDGVLSVTVNEVNQPPVFDPVDPNQLAIAGEPFTLDLHATDQDIPAQTISYSIVPQDPPYTQITVDGQTGLMTWNPAAAETRTVTVRASDDYEPSSTADITVQIEARAPVDDRVTTKTNIPLVIFPLENDGTNAGLSLVDPPSHGTHMISGDAILYIPKAGYTGEDISRYSMQYDDTRANTYSAQITVTVSGDITNRPPVLDRIPDRTIAQSETLTFSVTATDRDEDDDIQYMLFEPPDGATITPDGIFSWTPTADHSGAYDIVFVAADNDRMADERTATITVSDP